MKKIFLLTLIVLCASAYRTTAQKLEMKWKTDTLLHTAESVIFDASKNTLYVSCIDGKPDEKDGKGFISKVSVDGKIEKSDWASGLDAPKGMGIYKNKLYVADITRVDVIDIQTGKVTAKIEIEGAKFLNDITVDKAGNVYISDSQTGKIHVLKNDKAEVYFESPEIKGPNGLLALDRELYILDFSSGINYKLSADKNLTKFAETSKGADGVVLAGDGGYFVSSWNGEVYYVSAQGQATKLLDTKDQQISAADIEYDVKSKTLYVPTFFKNGVTAYTFSK
jgi:sugar lactone lactonase YvrE